MKVFLMAASLLVGAAVSASAQEIVLKVDRLEAQTLINALSEHPWKDVNPLMQKLIGQANEQLMPPKPAASKEMPKVDKEKKPDEKPKDETK